MSAQSAGSSRFTAWAFLVPFVVVFLVFTAWPLLQSMILATQQTFGPKTSRFVFLSNFSALLTDPLFRRALGNTVVYALSSVLLQLPLSLGLALLLDRPGIRGRMIFRLIFFSPSLIGIVFVALLFSPIFEKNTGLLNVWLSSWFGFDPEFPWTERYVMGALIVASLWMYVGFNMVYFLAALQNVDQELHEAAVVDGAGPWARFRHVTVPAIRPVASFVVLLSLIGSFQLFELPFVLLNNTAGPDNRGLTIVMYLYQTGFETGDLGYASAIGWALAVILILVAVLQRRLLRRYEFQR
ncbi:MAG: sugar ABC transporter permease [Planctomycetes bacterium]|nr:sugar ABC transporter permease [Planctomycetota bacterium]